MAATTTITVRVTNDARDKLDRLAALTRRSRSFLAAEALDVYLKFELEILEGIEEGIEDMRAGRVVPHEQVVAETQAIVDAARAQRARRSAKPKKAPSAGKKAAA